MTCPHCGDHGWFALDKQGQRVACSCRRCSECDGHGHEPSSARRRPRACRPCGGTGNAPGWLQDAPHDVIPMVKVSRQAPQEESALAVNLTLPLPPSSNNAYINKRGGGGRILSKRGREYKSEAAMLAMGQGARRIHGDVSISGTIYLDSRRRDLSNCIKLMEDSLKGICYADDKQVAHLDLHRRYDRGNPRCEITVAPYTEARTHPQQEAAAA